MRARPRRAATRLAALLLGALVTALLPPAGAEGGREPAAGRGAGPGPDWEAASARWNAGLAWKPARMEIESEELGPDGALKSRETRILALSYPRGPDEPESKVLRVLKDGKDVTGEERPSRGRGGGPPGGMDSFPDPIPFAAASAPRLVLGPPEPLAGGGYERGYRVEGQVPVTGRVRFGADGTPRSLEYGYGKLPVFLPEFSGEAFFSAGPDGSLLASGLGFRGRATVLVATRRFRVSLRFSDWIKPAAK